MIRCWSTSLSRAFGHGDGHEETTALSTRARVVRSLDKGTCHSLDKGTRHGVERIVVKPGGNLSLQHHRRAEHWVVVRGTALATLGDKVRMLQENESVRIPLGTLHCPEDPGRIDLELIEVQSGSNLGENAIVRHQDIHRRA